MACLYNRSYPSAAAVVFGVHLSARAVSRLDPEYSGPAISKREKIPNLDDIEHYL